MLHRPVMIMAGGTGGHIYPALAVADYLKACGSEILWLGTNKGLESKVVPEHGYPLFYLDVSGVRGKGLIKKLIAPFNILKAILQSLSIMKQQKPAAVLGMGGFASGPGGIAAFLLGIPLCIHEQNSIAGLTNKLLKPFARFVMQAFPNTFNQSKKVLTTGNPVRKEILALAESGQQDIKNDEGINLLIIGGSLGAKRLNEVVPNAAKQLHENIKLNIRHQCGDKHHSSTSQIYTDLQIEASVEPFIKDMAAAYQWADLIICRAGAMTVAEVSIVGIPSIFIPYPYAVDDHQTANARYLTDKNLAKLIQETELTESILVKAIEELCQSQQHLNKLAVEIRKLGKVNATQLVAEQCLEAMHV